MKPQWPLMAPPSASDSLEALEGDDGGCLAGAWLWVVAAMATITDERTRRHSRDVRGTRADRRSPLNFWWLLSTRRMMAGRKEAEQRRPSEIKRASIKALSAFCPLWQGREVGNSGGASVKSQWQRQLHAQAVEGIVNEQRQPVAAPLHYESSTHTRCIPPVTSTVSARFAQLNLFISV